MSVVPGPPSKSAWVQDRVQDQVRVDKDQIRRSMRPFLWKNATLSLAKTVCNYDTLFEVWSSSPGLPEWAKLS